MSVTEESFRNLEDLAQKGFSELNYDLFRQSLLRSDPTAQMTDKRDFLFETDDVSWMSHPLLTSPGAKKT